MKLTKWLMVIFAAAMVFSFKVDTNAATSTGVFYWWSSSSSGYYGNDGVWQSWYTNPPEQPEHRYDMNCNQIPWDGYVEQSREWSGSVFYATDGHWKRKVVVTYYKSDPEVFTGITLSKSSVTVNGLNATGERITVTANYSTGRTQDVTGSTYWQTSNSNVAWVIDYNGTVKSGGSPGNATVTAIYNGKSTSGTVTVIGPPVDTTPPANPTFSVTNLSNSVILTINYSSDSSVKVYRIGDGQYQNYTGPITIGTNTTIYAKAQDAAGNWSGESSYAVNFIDRTPPAAPTFTVSGTTANGVVITINYSSDSVVKVYRIGEGQYQNYYGTITINSNSILYAKGQDAAGNWSGESSYVVNSIDTTPPIGSVKINGDDQTTNTPNVVLALWATDTGSGVAKMIISNEPNFYGAGWENYSSTRNWALSSGSGVKTVFVKFKDNAGNESSVYTNTINYDADGPALPTFSAVTNANGTVTLIINFSQDSVVKLYKIGNGPYEDYTVPIVIGDNATVYAKAQDSSGNWSGEANYTVNSVDRTPPTGSVRINTNYLWPGNLNVTLTITAADTGSGVSQMMVSNDANFSWSAWEPFAATKSWTLTPYGDVKTVYVKFKDASDNVSAVYSDTVILNTTPNIPYIPSMPVANIIGGVYYQVQWITLTAESGAVIRYTLDGTEPNEYSISYSSPIIIYNTTTLKAKAFKNGYASPTLTAVYVISNNQDDTDLLARARVFYNQGRYDEAIELLNRLLSKDGRNEPALMLLIDCYIKKGDLYGAKSRLRQIVYLYEYPRVVNRFAELCIEKGESVEAREMIEEILPKYPNEIYLYRTLASAYGELYADGIKVYVYGEEVNFAHYDHIYPVIIDGRTLIPIRALSETLGARVDWDYRLRKASIYLDDRMIEIVDKSANAKVDGVTYKLDVPARIMGDRLMVPLRFISENFGKEVNWFKIGDEASIISVTE